MGREHKTAADYLAEATALDTAWDEREKREAPLRTFGELVGDFAQRTAVALGRGVAAVTLTENLARALGISANGSTLNAGRHCETVAIATAAGVVRIEVGE